MKHRLLFLVSGHDVPSTRFRINVWLPALRVAGFQCDVATSIPGKYDFWKFLGWRASQMIKRAVRRWHILLAWFRRYDLIVIERELFDTPNADLEKRFRRLDARLVLDYDDAVFLRYPEKFAQLASMCDAVIAGNSALASHASIFNDHVIVIPTCVDTDEFVPTTNLEHSGPVVIGWIGTPSNVPMLEIIAPALKVLSQRHEFVLRIVTAPCELPDSIRQSGVPTELVLWRYGQEVHELQQFDIGIMPLISDQWTMHKCGFKLLQYMSVGIAAVASPVGVNCEIIDDGTNGFLADTATEWAEVLGKLIASPALRRLTGAAARETVERSYSLNAWRQPLINFLDQTIESGTVRNS
ncbi:MAG: glycosyltransferase family 4 protein [Planctomycetota bacterium]|nr:glycosyltransferase family 4 protein [Planctomycetota bacterium]